MAFDVLFKRLAVGAIKPHKDRDEDAGYDLYALEDTVVLSIPKAACSWAVKLVCYITGYDRSTEVNLDAPSIFGTKIKTGIAMALPKCHVGIIHDRSGMGSKALKVMGGVIDNTYRGDITVCLINLSFQDYEIKAGNKIAQLIVSKFENINLIEAEDLDQTDRGERGFGSSGN